MSDGNTVYNLLRSRDILWGNKFSGTAQKIVCSHVWVQPIISSEAFARIFKPGHTYTLSSQYKIIEPAPDTYHREDRFGLLIHENSFTTDVPFLRIQNNPTAGYTARISKTFTLAANLPSDIGLVAYSDYSRDENGVSHTGILEISDLMIVEGDTPAAWAPAEGETLTADGGGGGMTEPTNLVITQPDENEVQTIAGASPPTIKSFIRSVLSADKMTATTDVHIGITINPDQEIPVGDLMPYVRYGGDGGYYNYANAARNAAPIPANTWTRIEGTCTVPAGMTPEAASIGWSGKTTDMHYRACNFVVYPLTGGRIVRARGANDGSKPTGVMTWNGTKGTLKTKEYSVDDVCTIQPDSNLKCINFVFE